MVKEEGGPENNDSPGSSNRGSRGEDNSVDPSMKLRQLKKDYFFFFTGYYDWMMKENRDNNEGDRSMHTRDDMVPLSPLDKFHKMIAGSKKKCLKGKKAKNYMKAMGLSKLTEILSDIRVCVGKEDKTISEIKIRADKINYRVEGLPEPFASMELGIPVDIILRYDSSGLLNNAILEIIAPWYEEEFYRMEITPGPQDRHEYVDKAYYELLAKIAGNMKSQLYALCPLLGEKKVTDYVLLLNAEVYIGPSNQDGLLRIESKLKPLSGRISVKITIPLIILGADSDQYLEEEKYVDISKLFPLKEIIEETLPECSYNRQIGVWEYKGSKIYATFSTDEAVKELTRSSKVFERLRETYTSLADDIRAADELEPITEATSTTAKAIIHLFDCEINAIEYFLFGRKYFNPREPLSLVKTLVKTVEYTYHSGYLHGGNLIYVIPRTIRLLEYLYSKLIVGRALLYGGKVPYILRAPAVYAISHILRIIAEEAEIDEKNLAIELYGVEVPVTDRFIDYVLYLRRNILPRLRELGERRER